MIDDRTLLADYARGRSEAAFGELVRRHLPLVYAAALRRTNGDSHRAHDIAQRVFTTVARDAARLSRHPALTGWLHAATRSAAIDVLRTERRRRLREEKASAMETASAPAEPIADWDQLRPVLDAAIDELGDGDRSAVLLRYFEGRPLAGVASALRVSEEAARKRVDRALARLGALLARRGITSTGSALALLLTQQPAIAIPAGMAASVTTAAVAGTGAALTASTAGFLFMTTSKTVAATAATLALVALGTAFHQARTARAAMATIATLHAERDQLQAAVTTLNTRARTAGERLAATVGTTPAPAVPPPAPPATPRRHTQGPAMDYVLEHPDTHAAFTKQQELRVQTRYDRFLQASGLPTEKQEAVVKALSDAAARELDVMSALHAQGYGVGNLPQDPAAGEKMRALIMQNQQETRARLHELLGDDGLRRFAQFSNLIPERNVADRLAEHLYHTAEPLTATQGEQLTQALAQHRFTPRPTPGPTNTLAGTFISPVTFNGRMGQAMQQNGMNQLDWQAPVTDAALDGARAILTPRQFAALQRLQSRQVTEFQLAPPPPSATKAVAGDK